MTFPGASYDNWKTRSPDDEPEAMEAAFEAMEKKAAEEIAAASNAWQEKWGATACPACFGWGGKSFYQSHPYGSTTAQEPMFDACEELPAGQCHRCGAHGLSEDGDGPCIKCGWNYDDGDPIVRA